MLELREWWQAGQFTKEHWMILGKGPSFAKHGHYDLTPYHTIGLNHVVNKTAVEVAHVIDIEVISDCSQMLDQNCKWLVMPRFPHNKMDVGNQRLEHYFDKFPILRALSEANRLIWYNFRSGRPVDDSPVIEGRYFSVEAVFNILGELGVKDVKSLGIDGGRLLSSDFAEINFQAALPNNRVTYNRQFKEIRKIVNRHNITYEPLVEPLRIFCGTDESQRVATRVLEYSINKNTTSAINFEPMFNIGLPTPKKIEHRARTEFSFCRFTIPQLVSFKGRALYLDADMLVFGDIQNLWNINFEDAPVMCTRQTEIPTAWQDQPVHFQPGRQMSVMMLDCERLDWDINKIIAGLDEDKYSYQQLMSDLCIIPPEQISERIPPQWNCLEWYDPEQTQLLHYTVVPSQPWKNDKNTLTILWEKEFHEAYEAGAIAQEEIIEGTIRGYLKPSLAQSVGINISSNHRRNSTYKVWGTPKISRGLASRLANSIKKRVNKLRF